MVSELVSKAKESKRDYMNADDAMIMRSMVEKIIVFDDRMDIHLRCGVVAREKYM